MTERPHIIGPNARYWAERTLSAERAVRTPNPNERAEFRANEGEGEEHKQRQRENATSSPFCYSETFIEPPAS